MTHKCITTHELSPIEVHIICVKSCLSADLLVVICMVCRCIKYIEEQLMITSFPIIHH